MKNYIKSLLILIFPLVLYSMINTGINRVDAWSKEPILKPWKMAEEMQLDVSEINNKIANEQLGIDLLELNREAETRRDIRNYSIFGGLAAFVLLMLLAAKWLSTRINS